MMTRCECHDLSFSWLMAYARRHGIADVERLARETKCCTGCGSCRPYLVELLRSGKLRVGDRLIDFPVMELPDDPAAAAGRAPRERLQQVEDQPEHDDEDDPEP